MKLQAVDGNTQRLDGGAMFGNCPKALWQRWIQPDEQNRIPLACRSLLVTSDNGEHTLIDAGIGAFFEPKLKDRYGVEQSEHLLVRNLEKLGIQTTEIHNIILTHLHFDHAGGLLTPFDSGAPELQFPNARIFVGTEHWQHANHPPIRERQSYLPHLHRLLEESGRLVLIEDQDCPELDLDITFDRHSGHSVGVLLPILETGDGPVWFVSDLAPGIPWVHLPITMGYDRFPERLVEEKARVFAEVVRRKGRLFFTHDPSTAWAEVTQDEEGRYRGIPIDLPIHN